MITLTAIGNAERATTWDAVSRLLRVPGVTNVRCAISFLMESGARIVYSDLCRLTDAGAAVTIIFGDDFLLSQSSALRSLQSAGCDLRLHAGETHPGFHPKMWIVDYADQTRAAVVGSSNLSRGGLISNAEANLVMQGTVDELGFFDEFWASFLGESSPFGADELANYIDSERAAAAPYMAPRATTTPAVAAREVAAHIRAWQRYIAHPQRIGQYERWRGWYLVPEQGQLTQERLRELAAILRQVLRRREYRQSGVIGFGTDTNGIANAVAVLDGAGIATQHHFTDRERRDLFIRQQRLYLLTFEFLIEVSRNSFELTSTGLAFARARSDRHRRQLFTDALARKTWPFGPIVFYPFLRELIDRVPDRRLYYDEMSLIVIHTYHHAELPGITNLVSTYRALPDASRTQVSDSADRRLRSLLDRYGGGTAYGRYRRKVADLMVAFGTTIGMRYVDAEPESRSHIERV